MKNIGWPRGIIRRIVLWSALIMAIFLGIQAFFFLVVGDDFYVFARQRILELRVKEIIKSIENMDSSTDVHRAFESIYWQRGITLGLTDLSGKPVAGFTFHDSNGDWLVKDQSGQLLQLNFSSFADGALPYGSIEQGTSLEVTAFPSDKYPQYYFATTVTLGDRTYTGYRQLLPIRHSVSFTEDDILPYDSDEEMLLKDYRKSYRQYYDNNLHMIDSKAVPVKRTVTFVKAFDLRKNRSVNTIHAWASLDETQTWLMNLQGGQSLSQLKAQSTVIKDSYSENRKIALLEPLIVMGKPHLLFTYLPLERNREIFKTIWFFQLCTAILAFGFSWLATTILSAKFVAPFLEINRVTKRMVQLDFSERCTEGRQDEVGMLASSINHLADKVQGSITQMRDINGQLNRMNDELSESLAQKQQADAMRRQFLADVSHELKTPLTVIKGVAEGIELGLYASQDKQYVKRIVEEVNDLTKLVHNLLEVSKLESGELELCLMPTHLGDVIHRTHRKMALLAEEKLLNVTFDLADGFVLADDDQLSSCIRNLYSNAVQYTPKGGYIHWHGELTRRDEIDRLCLSVTNGPCEIPEAEIPRIMQPYYRLDKSRERSSSGTGLGLAIVRGILETHGSSLSIHNSPQGVVMAFSMPLVDVAYIE